MIDVGRSGIGVGRLRLDATGVTRTGFFRTRTMAWRDVVSYRLGIRLTGSPWDISYLLPVTQQIADIRDFQRALVGDSRVRATIELVDAGRQTLSFGWPFRHHVRAIAHVLERLHEPTLERARAQLARVGAATFEGLVLSPTEVTLGAAAPLARERVEAIELFDNSPVELRILVPAKVWPYARIRLDAIADLGAALTLATELGYPIRGRALFDAFMP